MNPAFVPAAIVGGTALSYLVAAAGLAADVALKWALAPTWREMLRGAAGW